MSNSFDSGVARYIIGKATLTIAFPVDYRGNARICCEVCPFYSMTSKRCHITGKPTEFPSKYVGSHCPFEIEYENTMGENAQEMENDL